MWKFHLWAKAMGSKRQCPAKEVQLADPSTFVILKEVLLELFQSVFLQLQFFPISEIPSTLNRTNFFDNEFFRNTFRIDITKNPMSLFPLAIMVCASFSLNDSNPYGFVKSTIFSSKFKSTKTRSPGSHCRLTYDK